MENRSSTVLRRAADGRLMVLIFVMAMCLGLGSAARAQQSVPFAWQASTSTNTAGYMIRYGNAPANCTNQVDAGANTNFTITGLQAGQTNYFVVVAYDSNHVDSLPSNMVTNYIPVVALGTPVITWANPAAVVFGAALSGVQLNATANVPGSFSYNPASGAVLPVGANQLTALFTPADTNSYTSASASVSLIVLPATPVITWANPMPVNYGTALGQAQLSATANVPGSFSYNPPNGAVLSAGINQLTATFTPADTNDFTSVSASVSLIVQSVTPVVTWANPMPIIYGTVLNGSQLNATASVPGTFSYNPTNGAVLLAGTNQLTVTFIPTDTNSFRAVSASADLVVQPAPPVITWTNATPIIYGAALSQEQLNATASVPGTFSYTPTNGAVLDAGTNELTVTFVPTDTNNFVSASTNINLIVQPATPVITWANPSPIHYGLALSDAQLDAIASVPGTFSYNPGNGAVLPAGANQLVATFTPTDTNNFTEVSATASIVVQAAVPAITWTNPTPIIYGSALSQAQLNATASVPGLFSYTPTNGTVLLAGTNELIATFTPTDTNNFTSVSMNVDLLVQPATPVITWTNATAITYGTALSEAQLNATANVPGTFSYDPTNGTVLPAGTNQLTATFTPADTNNFTGASATANVVVQPILTNTTLVVPTIIPAPVQITAVSSSPPSITLNFPTTAGQSYFIQASTNLKNWKTVWQTTATSNGWTQFQDPIAPGASMRFYRTVSNQ